MVVLSLAEFVVLYGEQRARVTARRLDSGQVARVGAPELDAANAALARTGAFLQAHLQLAE